MQIFECPACAQSTYFHNLSCACGQALVFDVEAQTMRTDLAPCPNREEIGCNWAATNLEGGLCFSCAMTDVVPDLREPANLGHWSETELSKRWVLANMARWGWFVGADPGARPRFRLLSEQTLAGHEAVVMGHASGVITINVSEATDALRVARREALGEQYRTMIGHIRHELAHFLFERLSEDPPFLDGFRELFGEERADYTAALEAHYANPKQNDGSYITDYATAHPHEDWAETVAHLLHLVDLTDSVAAAGLSTPQGPPAGYDAYQEGDPQLLLNLASEVVLAVNHVNRALDLPDLYPFVLTPPVRQKIEFAHKHLSSRAAPHQ